MTDADYLYAFQQIIMPIAHEFCPDFVIGLFLLLLSPNFIDDWLIVSAGYDAAAGDVLGEMKVSPAGFAHMTDMLSQLAHGRLVLALEVCQSLTCD